MIKELVAEKSYIIKIEFPEQHKGVQLTRSAIGRNEVVQVSEVKDSEHIHMLRVRFYKKCGWYDVYLADFDELNIFTAADLQSKK